MGKYLIYFVSFLFVMATLYGLFRFVLWALWSDKDGFRSMNRQHLEDLKHAYSKKIDELTDLKEIASLEEKITKINKELKKFR